VLRRVGRELVLAFGTEREVDGPLTGLVGADRRRGDLVAREQDAVLGDLGGARRGQGRRRQLRALTRRLRERTEGDEVETARGADEAPDLVRVLDARHLDDDPVVALDDDLRLGDARLVDAIDDDLAQHGEVVAARDLAFGRQHLVLDPQAPLQVESELGLQVPGGARVLAAKRRERDSHEVHQDREQADDDDQNRAGASHRGGMIQAAAVPRRTPLEPRP
jgi:hypothetical protein